MDPRAESVLRRFVGMLGGEVHVAVRRGSGRTARWETTTEIAEAVTDFRPAEGIVELERRGTTLRLHFAEEQVLTLLRGAGSDGGEVWGTPLTDEEAAARFLTIYLAESVDPQEAHSSGWWEYENTRFVPLPPWEAFARRKQRDDHR